MAKILFLEVKVTRAWPGAQECWGEKQDRRKAALHFPGLCWGSERAAGSLSTAPGTGICFPGPAASFGSLLEGVNCVRGIEITVVPGKH